MYAVTVKDNHYNDLKFDYYTLSEAQPLMEKAVDQGYTIIISKKEEPEQEPEEE